MKIILTHPNADFDAAAAVLAAHKLNPDAIPVLPDRQNRNVANFLMLYRSGLPFIFERDLPHEPITKVILVDTQRLPAIKNLPSQVPLEIIDHHQPFTRDDLKPHETFESEELGAVTTLLVERIQKRNIALTPIEATLLTLGIYEDTGSLSYGTTTSRDIRAAAWLIEQNAVLDTVRRFLFPQLNDEQQALYESLIPAAESRVIQGQTVILSTATVDEYIAEISSVVHRLRDVLDPAVLFVLVQMPDNLLLVCRSTGDALDVGEIARLYGGGGHERAAAATIYDRKIREIVPDLWKHVQRLTRPMTRVRDLMSLGVQTVTTDQKASDVVQQVRRIGHEGYPVLKDGQVIGLLTRRELDRTLEHHLGNMTVGEIMTAGNVSLRPDDSVHKLEQTMVESGWGQIPVLDDQDQVMGIVTRTDLIQHWASTHPRQAEPQPTISDDQITQVMGGPIATLIDTIVAEAHQHNLSMYLVGGAVRDLLLNRKNYDIDFVIEGSAIEFAQQLTAKYNGDLHVYRPFGTAKWLLDGKTSLNLLPDDMPDHIDFASARNEFYEHPTALPTVYQSSIKLDLQRRDFTINTLALQVSPAAVKGRILDFYGGLADLQNRLIRVLHSLSFVDDPTRILRAFRFAHRLNFEVEQRTLEHITSALSMLSRITGERIRNEIELLLQEADPAQPLLKMQQMGILRAIHAAFVVSSELATQFNAAEQHTVPWLEATPDEVKLRWHILMAHLPPQDVEALCERLLFGQRFVNALVDTSRLLHEKDRLAQDDVRPSTVVRLLEDVSPLSLFVVWLLSGNVLVRERIHTYMMEWRDIHPTTTGHDLRASGLSPGPQYQVILDALRKARLDGEIASDDEERSLLNTLIEQEKTRDDRT